MRQADGRDSLRRTLRLLLLLVVGHGHLSDAASGQGSSFRGRERRRECRHLVRRDLLLRRVRLLAGLGAVVLLLLLLVLLEVVRLWLLLAVARGCRLGHDVHRHGTPVLVVVRAHLGAISGGLLLLVVLRRRRPRICRRGSLGVGRQLLVVLCAGVGRLLLLRWWLLLRRRRVDRVLRAVDRRPPARLPPRRRRGGVAAGGGCVGLGVLLLHLWRLLLHGSGLRRRVLRLLRGGVVHGLLLLVLQWLVLWLLRRLRRLNVSVGRGRRLLLLLLLLRWRLMLVMLLIRRLMWRL